MHIQSATVKPAHPPPQATLPTPASSTGGSSGGSYGDASALFLHSSDRNLSGLYSPRGSHARNISGPALQPTYAPSSFANSMPSGHRLNSPPYNLNPIRGQATDLHQQGIHTQLPNPLYESWPTTPTHHMPAPHAPSQYSTPRPSWDLGMQLGVGNSMAVYNDGGQGGNPTGVDTQHSLHHSEGERAVSSGEILASLKDGGQGSGGHLRHQVRTA